MAIKPIDCLALSQLEENLVSKLEDQLDVKLREQFTRHGMSVDIDLDKHNERVLNALLDRYRKVGWQVSVGHKPASGDDMRGLDSQPARYVLTFSEASSESSYDRGGVYDR